MRVDFFSLFLGAVALPANVESNEGPSPHTHTHQTPAERKSAENSASASKLLHAPLVLHIGGQGSVAARGVEAEEAVKAKPSTARVNQTERKAAGEAGAGAGAGQGGRGQGSEEGVGSGGRGRGRRAAGDVDAPPEAEGETVCGEGDAGSDSSALSLSHRSTVDANLSGHLSHSSDDCGGGGV